MAKTAGYELQQILERNKGKKIDYILNIKAFNLSLEVGDYQGAIEYWNSLFKSQVKNKTNCSCHGY